MFIFLKCFSRSGKENDNIESLGGGGGEEEKKEDMFRFALYI